MASDLNGANGAGPMSTATLGRRRMATRPREALERFAGKSAEVARLRARVEVARIVGDGADERRASRADSRRRAESPSFKDCDAALLTRRRAANTTSRC